MAKTVGFPIQRVRQTKKSASGCGSDRNSSRAWEHSRAECVFDQPAWHAHVKPDAIAQTVRGPGRCRIDECAVTGLQDHDRVILRIPSSPFELGDYGAESVFRMRARRGE